MGKRFRTTLEKRMHTSSCRSALGLRMYYTGRKKPLKTAKISVTEGIEQIMRLLEIE